MTGRRGKGLYDGIRARPCLRNRDFRQLRLQASPNKPTLQPFITFERLQRPNVIRHGSADQGVLAGQRRFILTRAYLTGGCIIAKDALSIARTDLGLQPGPRRDTRTDGEVRQQVLVVGLVGRVDGDRRPGRLRLRGASSTRVRPAPGPERAQIRP